MLTISDLQTLIFDSNILWTEHVALRLRERGIKRVDVITCVNNGKIIEQYLDDTPFPSCLILGSSTSDKPLHVVCSLDPGVICCIITAYHPSLDKWESDYKTRKRGN